MDFTEKLHDIDRRRALLNEHRPLTEGELVQLVADYLSGRLDEMLRLLEQIEKTDEPTMG